MNKRGFPAEDKAESVSAGIMQGSSLWKFAENAAHTIGQTAEKVGKSIENAAAKISEMKSDER